MQETQMPRTDGGASRKIASGIDRRLRTQNGMNQQQQALKCPRCDSLNTKFCYYNNYNLSQPRHFCKACRRYWTKGGVLRKVPVGGGCRRAKRTAKATPSLTPCVFADDLHKDNENSSSDGSSLEAASGNTSFSSGPQFSDLGLFIDHACEGAGSMFPEIGGLVTSSEDVMTSSREVGSDDRDLLMFGSQGGDYLDQTGRIDSEIFDLAGTVDQTYWIHSPWPDHHDHHSVFHYLPTI